MYGLKQLTKRSEPVARLLGLILPTFYACIFHTKELRSAFFYLHATSEKLPKRLSYEKGTLKMLKLTPRVDFTNIFAKIFSRIIWEAFFWQKAICKWCTDLSNFGWQFCLEFYCWNWMGIFLPNPVCLQLQPWQTKFCEINPL